MTEDIATVSVTTTETTEETWNKTTHHCPQCGQCAVWQKMHPTNAIYFGFTGDRSVCLKCGQGFNLQMYSTNDGLEQRLVQLRAR